MASAGIKLTTNGIPELKTMVRDLSAKQVAASAKVGTNAACREMAKSLKQLMRAYRKARKKTTRGNKNATQFTGESIKSIRIGTPRGHRKRTDRVGSVVYFAGKTPGWYGRLLSSGWNHVAWGVRTGQRIPGTNAVPNAFSASQGHASQVMSDRFYKSLQAKIDRYNAKHSGGK